MRVQESVRRDLMFFCSARQKFVDGVYYVWVAQAALFEQGFSFGLRWLDRRIKYKTGGFLGVGALQARHRFATRGTGRTVFGIRPFALERRATLLAGDHH